jgi:hypothetical protein
MSKQKITINQLTRALCVFVPTLLLAFFLACSSSGKLITTQCAGFTGSFTNASLGGSGTQYAYELSGWIQSSAGTFVPYSEAGYIVIDGNGNVTGGTDGFWGTITGGTYNITSIGSGTLLLNTSNSSTGKTQALNWAISVANDTSSSAGSFAVIETDTFANSAGAAYEQSASALGTAPSGTFTFRTHALPVGTSITGAEDSAGLLTFSGTNVTGTEDWVNGGVGSGQFTNVSGTFTAPSSSGLGAVSFIDGLGARSFDYFVIDANHLLLYETDTANAGLGLGRAEAQQAPTGGFTNSSLSGSFAFGGRGDTSVSGPGGVSSVGQLATDGNGNVTGGALDDVRDGAAQLGQSIAASTYSLASNGRVTASLSGSVSGGINVVFYLVSSTRAFFVVVNDTTTVEDGSADQQSSTAFANSAYSGQYAFVMGGYVSGTPVGRVGANLADGNGNLGWNQQVNPSTSVAAACLSGTYSVAANGRVTASVTSLSSNLVFYLVSPNSLYTLQGDTGAQVPGAMVNQDHQIAPIGSYF